MSLPLQGRQNQDPSFRRKPPPHC